MNKHSNFDGLARPPACAIRAHDPDDAPLQAWRTLPARAFDAAKRRAVAASVATISSTWEDWRKAVGSDAPAAIKLALSLNPRKKISLRVDLVMTVLLRCALEGNAAAALVLSHLLRRMRIDPSVRHQLSTSWLAYNLTSIAPLRGRFSLDAFGGVRPGEKG
ncbi:MAG: hypothetical protein JWP51_3330 [Bradyrhizobium sp.]|nr:hypothetical protein [Bradyrhizobium sp.]